MRLISIVLSTLLCIACGRGEPAAPADLAAQPAEEPRTEEPRAEEPLAAVIAPGDAFLIERGPCFGPCPVYSARVIVGDRLVFSGERFTALTGVREKTMPQGALAQLLLIAQAHSFAGMASNVDGAGLDCPEPAEDLPIASVAIKSAAVNHAARFVEGCGGEADAMLAEFDAALDLGSWIGPRDSYLGGRKTP